MPGGMTSDVMTQGYDDEAGHVAQNSVPRGWPTPGVRASRSPRLDTVQEPDNEPDNSKCTRQPWQWISSIKGSRHNEGLVDEPDTVSAQEPDGWPRNSKRTKWKDVQPSMCYMIDCTCTYMHALGLFYVRTFLRSYVLLRHFKHHRVRFY